MPNDKQTQVEVTPIVRCETGLDVTQTVMIHRNFGDQTGGGIILTNYEASLNAGYRRIDGFQLFDTHIVPGTGPVLGVCVFNNGVVACQTENVYFSSGTGWSQINSGNLRTNAQTKYRFWRYNFNGTSKIVIVDGANYPATWDGTTYTVLTNAPANPAYATVFQQCMFFGGFSANPGAIIFSAPENETDYTSNDGAGEIVVGDTVVGLHGFKNQLIIFCDKSIWQLTGTNVANFQLVPIALNLGCVAPDSIVEAGADVLFLGPDGFRTVTGTNILGDTQIETVSKQIQPIVNAIAPTAGVNICAAALRSKSQYRLFYNTSGQASSIAMGVIGCLRKFSTIVTTATGYSTIAWEWYQTQGIMPYSCYSDYIGSVEYLVHGGWDGYVYQQGVGTSFNGANISSQFRTPDIDFGDPTIRKVISHILVYFKVEGDMSLNMNVVYDRNAANVSQSPVYNFSFNGGSDFIYGQFIYGDFVYGQISTPFTRQTVEGSGFLAGLNFSTNDMNASHTIEGFSVEYKKLARR